MGQEFAQRALRRRSRHHVVAGAAMEPVVAALAEKPVVAVLGEYDALPSLSQERSPIQSPIVVDGPGHGCGHNLLGSAALLAATALKDWLAEAGLPGRVRYYGCPAEEGGAAKAFMVRAGAFDDADVAISWHPSSFWEVAPALALANTRADFVFTGRASHAAAAPHLGRSALDAVELMNVGVNYMREHMPSDARVHYAYLDAGGSAPNVVQSRAKVRYSIRALHSAEMLALVERVKDVARGAALMTGTDILGGDFFSRVNLPYVSNILVDQQSAGTVAWGVGEVPTLVLTMLIALEWYRTDKKDAQRQERQAQRDGDAELNAYNDYLASLGRARNDD